MDHLLAALSARVQRFTESEDKSGILDPAALDEAHQLWETTLPAGRSVQAVPVDVLLVLAYLHLARFQALPEGQDHGDLGTALGFFRLLMDRAPERVPDLIRSMLAQSQSEHTGDVERLAAEGRTAFDEYKRTGNHVALDAAVEAFLTAVADTPPGHPDRIRYLLDLTSSLGTRFERTRDSADLDAAIDAAQQAVAATTLGDPDHAMARSILGNCLGTRFGHTGDVADLGAAVEAGRQAVAASSPGDPARASYLSNLAASLGFRFGHTGDSADLDAAIDAGRQAVSAAPLEDPARAMYLSNLGAALRVRFNFAGDSADLDAAVDVGREAVATTPPSDPDHATYLSNLAVTLLNRSQRAGNSADLDAAIDAGRQAVASYPPGHPKRALCLSNLAISLRERFDRVGDSADLDAAVEAGREAVATTPPSDPNHATYLSNLAVTLLNRSQRAGNSADLDAAIDAGRQAVASSPPGHPNMSNYLSIVGNSLLARFEQAGENADLDAAMGSWQQASQRPTGIPSLRLAAARSWGAMAVGVGRMHEAAGGYAAAVELLSMVAWHGLNRMTREEQLAEWAGLASDAAACAVLDSHSSRAVELLEQGRSVLWAQALNLRSDLTRLAQKHPRLAKRLDTVRNILDTPVPDVMQAPAEREGGAASTVGGAQRQDASELRRRAAREWDDVLAQVRALERFEHFLATIPYPELAASAADGPVVIVNTSQYACHALIVDPGAAQPRTMDLPALTLDAAIDHANRMLAAQAGAASQGRPFQDREKDRHALLDILEWLWDVVAAPVLTALGHTSAPRMNDPWPRVWWCPTGPLTVLPIHAAGHHPRHRTNKSDVDSVLDRVVSSYAPTLTALTRARQPLQAGQVRQLAVGMPTTPGQPALPAVRAELEVLSRHFPPEAENHQLVDSQATRANVSAAITGHSWVHMACHARQEHVDPDRSGFALWDGTLTVTDLTAQPTLHRDLAFLSACQTATGSFRHLDEAIHLAAAMQFLGYHHVIATMWTIADSPAPYIADSIYTTLTSGRRPDPGRAAEALHQAIHALRNADPTDPLLWAPYIHLGP